MITPWSHLFTPFIPRTVGVASAAVIGIVNWAEATLGPNEITGVSDVVENVT